MTFASITTYVGPSLKPNITPDGFGGVFHELFTFTNFDGAGTVRRTFTDLAGLTIFGFVVVGGYHDWIQGVDGNGYPYVEAPAYPIPTFRTWDAGTFNTTLGIFVR